MNNKVLFSHRSKEPESGVLYVVGTPIGNLNDISERALNILKNVSLIACEDTRQTNKITQKYKIKNTLISFNKHNSLKKTSYIINNLREGKSVALVSDAGMPSICDPGEDLVKKVKSCEIDIICIPGPCAALTALVSSGMPASSFTFEGFLPKKKIEREKILLEISQHRKTTILFESPHRFKKLLKELLVFCGEGRQIHISRELTKKFEEHIGTTIERAIDIFENKEIVGEITLVIKGICEKKNVEINKSHLKKELYELIDAGLSLSAASKYLAKKRNTTKRIIYNLY
ncbi:16S rRNA (cytidine(1402)-2'-O)-methyltransferase [Prochlorococcus sp. AH-736-F09]|nr:16S rRNA (cytidine(1402)-2'-O)-methyltransferase [Prochlorococcus sp. AH-736-F09]